MSDTSELSNWTALPNGAYLVRTQAGVKHALRDFRSRCGLDDDERLHGKLPRRYPCVLTLNDHEYGISVQCCHLNRYHSEIQQLLRRLEELDPMLAELNAPSPAVIPPDANRGLTLWQGLKLRLFGIAPKQYLRK